MSVQQVKNDDLQKYINELMAEKDPKKRAVFARRLRADVWDLMSESDLEKVARAGIDVNRLRGPVRRVK